METQEEQEQQQSEESLFHDGVTVTQIVHNDEVQEEADDANPKNNTNDDDYEPPCFPVISVKEWYYYNNGNNEQQQQRPLPLLDIRSNEEWEQWHFGAPQQQDDDSSDDNSDDKKNNKRKNNMNITAVHIPLHALTQRSYELPPRKIPFCLLLSNQQQNNVTTSIVAKILNYTGKVVIVSSSGSDGDGSTCSSSHNNNNNKNQHHNPKARKMRQPWQVGGVILGNAKETLEQAKELGILVQQNESLFASSCTTTTTTAFQPLARLWEPDAMIQQVLLPLLVQWWRTTTACAASVSASCNQQQQQQQQGDMKKRTWEIWDLGAGSGRDACFLAEELKAATSNITSSTSTMNNDIEKEYQMPSFRVIAMDQRYRNTSKKHQNDDDDDQQYNKEEQEQSSPIMFWKRRGVANETKCRQVDLENETEMNALLLSASSTLEEKQYNAASCRRSSLVQCIYAVRYWNRPLVQRIANGSCNVLEKPGAIFALSTFGKPCVGAAWNFAHPKEKHVLERNELADIFRQSTDSNGHEKWRILYDKVVMDSDHGRTLIQFVAQRV